MDKLVSLLFRCQEILHFSFICVCGLFFFFLIPCLAAKKVCFSSLDCEIARSCDGVGIESSATKGQVDISFGFLLFGYQENSRFCFVH